MARLRKSYPRFLRQQRSQAAAAGLSAGLSAALALPSVAGVTVTPQTALTFTAYYAGVRVITEDAASLPLAVFRRMRKGGSKLVWDHPVSRLFNRSPDGEATDMNWRESFYSHALGWGNGYAEIEWSTDGEPLALHMQAPRDVTVRRDRSRGLTYRVQPNGSPGVELPPWKVLHFAGLGFDGLVGYSPVALARQAIGLGLAAETFGASLFGNGAIPKGVLRYPGRLKPEARDNLRDSFNRIHRGAANGNQVAVLEEGVEWVQTQIPPEEAQFLATRQFQVVEIARILRLPPHKIADYTQAHLANLEASNDDYLVSGLRPWTVRFEKAIQWKLLTRDEWDAGFYVKHDFRPLVLMLSKDRADYYRKLIEVGVYTASEVAEFEGQNPIPEKQGGNKRFRPVNLFPLDADPTTMPVPERIPGAGSEGSK